MFGLEAISRPLQAVNFACPYISIGRGASCLPALVYAPITNLRIQVRAIVHR